MPVTRRGLEAHQKASKETEDTNALLRQVLEQQKRILAALEKLASK